MQQFMKTIILDFDGTIADTRNSIILTVQATLEELGLPKGNVSDIKEFIGLPLRDTFVRVAHLSEGDILDRAIQLYRAKYNEISFNTVQLFPNVARVLEVLYKQGLIISVASSKGKDALLFLLNKLGIKPYISLIFGEEDIKNKKPAPDMALCILAKTKSDPRETLVIGDTVYDIAMGQGANCITCGVTYGNNTKEQLIGRKADYVINDFIEVLDIVNGTN
jgi:phosphoglycolate phosphatase